MSAFWPNEQGDHLSSHGVTAGPGMSVSHTTLSTDTRTHAALTVRLTSTHTVCVHGSNFSRETFKDFLQHNVIRAHEGLLKFF